jgi:hypothetical protein
MEGANKEVLLVLSFYYTAMTSGFSMSGIWINSPTANLYTDAFSNRSFLTEIAHFMYQFCIG